jgi:hypothetical protein
VTFGCDGSLALAELGWSLITVFRCVVSMPEWRNVCVDQLRRSQRAFRTSFTEQKSSFSGGVTTRSPPDSFT